ncbi:MAG: peptidase E [Hyphomicrobiales bacterium]|nr:MAG: peptidase E [Hyphomicrobiales bacterium]
MRLYLSSYRIGDRAGSLLALLGSGKRAAIVSNALDNISPTARSIYRDEVYDPHAEMRALGIETEELDLRRYFGRPDQLQRKLGEFDLVWATGGNAFVLRRAMKQSGFDDVIIGMLDRDDIVYGGFSAGAVVAAPTLRGIELMDDPAEVPAGYEADVTWDGLGLIDYSIVPHFRSSHRESAAAERAVRHLCGRGMRYRALRDSEVIVWTETRTPSVDALRIA